MPFCNTTLEDDHIREDPLWTVHGHDVNFHRLGLFIAAIFGLISVVISLFLVLQHARHYSRPHEQRHIIRILLMIPIYSMVSYLSFLYYRKSVYFEVLRDCYEAFAIASFFALLCNYIAPTLHEQKDHFRSMTPVNWFWGVFGLQKCTGGENKGPFRRPRSGLTWFNICWIGVFQYCLVRVLFTIVSVVTEAMDVYCAASLSPAFAHIWTVVFESLSVTIAMFFLVQFYIQLKDDLAEHKPFLKVLCIKLVIFFSFWQTIVISLISSANGPLKPTSKLSYQDIKVGIPNLLLCVEMAVFSVMHIFAFPYKRYMLNKLDTSLQPEHGNAPSRYVGGFLGIRAFADAFNPWDFVKALARGFRWLFVGYKTRGTDISYQQANKLPSDTSYNGAVYTAASNGNATELRRNDEDDRAGLLRNSALMPVNTLSTSHSRPSQQASYDDVSDQDMHDEAARYDLSAQRPGYYHAVTTDDDTEYHRPSQLQATHPAFRNENSRIDPNWDHWRGSNSGGSPAPRPGLSDRPPTYRSDDQWPSRI